MPRVCRHLNHHQPKLVGLAAPERCDGTPPGGALKIFQVRAPSALLAERMTLSEPSEDGGFRPSSWKLNHYHLKLVGLRRTESPLAAKAT